MRNYNSKTKVNSLQLVNNSQGKSKNRKVRTGNQLRSTSGKPLDNSISTLNNSESQPDSTLDNSKPGRGVTYRYFGPFMLLDSSKSGKKLALILSKNDEEKLRKASPGSNPLNKADSDAMREAMVCFGGITMLRAMDDAVNE
jgi:hypothetical protein